LVAWYRLDENSGVAVTDSSAEQLNGTLLGGSTFSGETAPIHKGKSFNGTTDYIEVGNQSAHNFGDGHFSISLWLYRNPNATTNLRALSKGASTDTAAQAGFAIFASDTTLNFTINPSGSRVFSTTTYNTNEWFHFVEVVERGGSRRLYKNGIEVDNDPAPVGSVTGSSTLRLGEYTGTGLKWDGALDDVRLYNKALSVSEIQSLFNLRQ